jgi:pimeloyl-ACP methyl ester carboxylesterase
LSFGTLQESRSPWTFKRLIAGLSSPTRWQRRVLKRRFKQAGLRPFTMPVAGGKLHVWRGGSGKETLVLLHGFGGSCLWQWAEMVGELSKRYQLLIPDLLWFGQSDGGDLEPSLQVQSETIRQLIRQTSSSPVHIAGISYGGFIAYLLANDSPEMVQSLTLIDCPATVMNKQDYHELLARFELPDMVPMMVPAGAKEMPRLMKLAFHKPPPVPRFAWADAHRVLFCEHVDARKALLNDLVAYLDEPARDDKTDQPVLIVWGEHDRLFPPELGERLQRHLGDRARLVRIADAAHAPIVEQAKAVNAALLDFLRPLNA